MTNWDKEYELLKKQRVLYNNSNEIVKSLKRNIWEYFREYGCLNRDIELNIQKPTNIYIAPTHRIHGSNMVNWVKNDENEIYVDDVFLDSQNNPILINCQLTHEVVHGLVQKKIGRQFKFGHMILNDEEKKISNDPLKYFDLTALDEACTQIVAEEINGFGLNEEQDYLFELKSAMRIVMIVFGKKEVLNQFCNNSTEFEDKFNSMTDGKFDAFVATMSRIYDLSKKRKYKNLSQEELEKLDNQINIYVEQLGSFLIRITKMDKDKAKYIRDEIKKAMNFYEQSEDYNSKSL